MMASCVFRKKGHFRIAYAKSAVGDLQSAMGIPIILGSRRSSTTYVLSVLAEANDLRPTFERLHPFVFEKIDRELASFVVGEYSFDLTEALARN